MDFFAIVSMGTYPIPTPSAEERAIYAASYGLLGTGPTPPVVVGIGLQKWFLFFGYYSHRR